MYKIRDLVPPKLFILQLTSNKTKGLILFWDESYHNTSPAGKGLTSWLSFVVSTVSLSLSHWYPGSGVVLNCIDS